MDVFVTGGTGTLGPWVIKELVERGHQVIALARSEEAAGRLRKLRVSPFPGDLKQPQGWMDRATSCDAVIHLARPPIEERALTDRQVVTALMKAARFRKEPLHLLTTGHIWLYPPSKGETLSENDDFDPIPALAYMTETVRSLIGARHMKVSILHPGLLIAPAAGLMHDMSEAILAGKPFRTRAKENTYWPLVGVEDLAKLLVSAMEKASFRLTAFATSVAGVTVADIGAALSKRLEKPFQLETAEPPEDLLPRWDLEEGYARSQVIPSNRARKLLKWQPELDSLDALADRHLEALTHP